jgi:hypothetical protein
MPITLSRKEFNPGQCERICRNDFNIPCNNKTMDFDALKTSISNCKNRKTNTLRHNEIANEKHTGTRTIDELFFIALYLI